ncbi:MAG: hypothetical protein ACK5PZ_21495 [Pirellula sp.]
MKNEAKKGWLQRLASPYPMNPENREDCVRGLRQAIRDDGGAQGTLLEALMWVRVGQIDQAHGIVESATRGIEAYIHGVVHRMEGDYWNAKYWFRQVRAPQLVESLNRHILRGAPKGYLYPWGTAVFDPIAFVDACESTACESKAPKIAGSSSFLNSAAGERPCSETLRGLALAEWEGLLAQVEIAE